MSIVVRRAVATDAEAIASLATELGYPSTAAESAGRLAELHERPGETVLVAAVDERVVGWIHVAIVYSLESAPFAEIRGLIVTADQRGAGIGSALVDSGERWSREQGCNRIRIRSNVVRTETHRFYEGRGFVVKKTQLVFDKPVR